jgi:hypothetical protein
MMQCLAAPFGSEAYWEASHIIVPRPQIGPHHQGTGRDRFAGLLPPNRTARRQGFGRRDGG